jgi:NADH-ubiquinone oxidoreductase chain 5
MGFPFLTGFYSKDIILEFTYSRFIVDALFIYFLGLISAVFTAIYSIRAIYFVFLGLDTNISYIYSKKFEKNIVECYVSNMYISMLVLIIGSIFLGYFFHNLMISISNNF